MNTRCIATAAIGLTAMLAAGCSTHVHSAAAAKASAQQATARSAAPTPDASQPDASDACATFIKAFRQFTQDGDLQSYLKATSNLNAPNDIKGAIAKFNGDVAVYAVATKHRVSLVTLQRDADIIKQDCGN